ncbi:MAG TPA: GntR family transcriptional regulator, partial [Bacillota bacterium]|nr:GntR family transcriptional regulator [Bacillota bacterium]
MSDHPQSGGRLTRHVAETVRHQIRSGYWAPRTRLPPDAELARHHGVGTNTVRRALALLAAEGLVVRGKGSGTRVAVHDSMAGRRRLIGIFVPSRRRIFPDIVTGADEGARAAGARIVVRTTEFNRDAELQAIDELLEMSPDGLVVVPTLEGLIDTDDYLHRLGSLDLPVVIAERRGPGAAAAGVSVVATDVHHAGYLAVQHLHRIGRRRLGLMSSRGTATSGD